MREITVAAIQMSSSGRMEDNIAKAAALASEAADKGAKIILLQELFETNYFCQKPLDPYHCLATTAADNQAIAYFAKFAREREVVMPISFFERANPVNYNSLAVIDASGEILGIYRKSHIPEGAGYEEKYYFAPGDTGFLVWDTAYARIGCGICWDQWFPEAARCMCLSGAELLFYPTAIGSEPLDPSMHSRAHWQTVMQGHAAANLTPVIAANRVGTEKEGDSSITFYGSSFITDEQGQIVHSLDETEEGICLATLDLDKIAEARRSWGVFRDRRPDLYGIIVQEDPHFFCK